MKTLSTLLVILEKSLMKQCACLSSPNFWIDIIKVIELRVIFSFGKLVRKINKISQLDFLENHAS